MVSTDKIVAGPTFNEELATRRMGFEPGARHGDQRVMLEPDHVRELVDLGFVVFKRPPATAPLSLGARASIRALRDANLYAREVAAEIGSVCGHRVVDTVPMPRNLHRDDVVVPSNLYTTAETALLSRLEPRSIRRLAAGSKGLVGCKVGGVWVFTDGDIARINTRSCRPTKEHNACPILRLS